MIVWPHRKPDGVVVDLAVIAADEISAGSCGLVQDRRRLDDLLQAHRDHELALRSDCHFVRTVETDTDGICVSAGRNGEIVFELMLVAVVEQVNARVKFLNADRSEGGDSVAPIPLWPDQVIDLRGKRLAGANGGVLVCASELNAERRCYCRAAGDELASIGQLDIG